MKLFSDLFGKKQVPPVESKPTDPPTNKNMIRVFDGYGRELFISKEQWRTNVLPGMIKSNWNNPESLYGVIVGTLQDGFHSDVVAAAEHLYKTDPIPSRAACVWGIVLMDEGRLDEAEKVFRDFISRHGEHGAILTNLAKVCSRRKDDSKASEILWRALEVDPNQDSGLLWYRAIYQERDGEPGALAAMLRVAALPGSWRAKLWLARTALESHKLDQALAYYHEILPSLEKPAPADVLMQISGDLGNAGNLAEIISLVEPHFVPEAHGVQVGNNLVKAHLELGQLDEARRVLNQLYSLKRPDWRETLSYWDSELAKKRLATENADLHDAPQISMIVIGGPIWFDPTSPVAKIFPRNLPVDIRVSFLGSTATVAADSDRAQHQLADDKGRMSRALPLFLAEQTTFNSNAHVQTLLPWVAGRVGGFVLSGSPWSAADASTYAGQPDPKSDYVVITHLNAQTELWGVELRLIRTADAQCLGNLACSFPRTKPQESIPELAHRLLELLAKETHVESRSPAKSYEVPRGENFPFYLLRLEQLLAVRCAAMETVQKDFLNGPREIVDGNIELCLSCPNNSTTRILLAQTLLTMKKSRPDVVPEFKEKIALLQKEKPLTDPAQGVIQQMFNDVFAS